jgi:hypothetical protein
MLFGGAGHLPIFDEISLSISSTLRAVILASKHPGWNRYELFRVFLRPGICILVQMSCKDSFAESYFADDYLGTEKYEVLICHFDGANPSKEFAEAQNSILPSFAWKFG